MLWLNTLTHGEYMNRNKKGLSESLNYLIVFLRWNFNSFPFLCVTGFALTMLESFTYPGFVGKHLYFSVELMAIVIFFSGILSGFTYLSEYGDSDTSVNIDIYLFVKNLCLISVFPVVIFLYILDSFIPSNRDSIILNSTNLLFPGRVIISFGFMAFFMAIYYVFINFYKYKQVAIIKRYLAHRTFKEMLTGILFYATIFLILVYSAKMDLPLFKYDLNFMVKNPGYSYEQKMGALVGPNYYYYMFIKNNTPEDAVILKPKQQGRWPDLSNEGYSRYFLYPRKFVSEEDGPDAIAKATHAFLIGNIKLINTEDLDRWPNFDLNSKEIILYSPDKRDIFTGVPGNFKFKTFPYPEKWGVIVIHKNQ